MKSEHTNHLNFRKKSSQLICNRKLSYILYRSTQWMTLGSVSAFLSIEMDCNPFLYLLHIFLRKTCLLWIGLIGLLSPKVLMKGVKILSPKRTLYPGDTTDNSTSRKFVNFSNSAVFAVWFEIKSSYRKMDVEELRYWLFWSKWKFLVLKLQVTPIFFKILSKSSLGKANELGSILSLVRFRYPCLCKSLIWMLQLIWDPE